MSAILTTQLRMHLYGGSKFSTRVEEIMCDGEPTGIIITTHTDGRPHYRLTEKRLDFKEETLDLLGKVEPGEIDKWIAARLPEGKVWEPEKMG